MKIKYLSIRNIASVETADIDFEHGPVDKTTGAPASLFLITGDTGSGKSVILDCISMALYGTTPRVKGVMGVKNNVYKYGEEGEISVNDIKQYTRLGISHKDPCYARLVFEGNDGVEYESTFNLGYNNQHKYRATAWTLRIGDSELIGTGRKDEIQARIVAAIGLTFEQFGRMAMLAQGQFANFLTGKKDERERILEQLTSTDHFTRYGDAISNIFKRAKEAKTIAENAYTTYNDLLLKDEEIERLNAELKALTADSSAVEAAANAENTRAKATAEHKAALETLTFCRGEFDMLAADLAGRKRSIDERNGILLGEKSWFESLGHRQEIFEKASLTIDRIEEFKGIELKVAESVELLEKAENARNEWAKKVKETEDALEQAVKNVADKDTHIATLTSEREQMKPETLLAQHAAASNRHKALADLAKDIQKHSSEKEETAAVAADVAKLTSSEKGLDEQAKARAVEEARLEKELHRASDLYTTMHLSVERNFNELRRRMADEHLSHCPLCRQGIADHSILAADDDFAHILSPLEENKNVLEGQYNEAKKAHAAANELLNTCRGSLKTRTAELKRLQKRDGEMSVAINNAIEALSLSREGDILAVIEVQIAATQKEIEDAKNRIDAAEALQKRITLLLGDRKKLDNARNEADNANKYASANFQLYQTNIATINENILGFDRRKKELLGSISTSLHGYNDRWMDNPTEAAAQLKTDAAAYAARRDKMAKFEKELSADTATLATLSLTASELQAQLSDIEPPTEATSTKSVSLSLPAIQKKWMELNSMVGAARSNLERCSKEIAESSAILTKFKEESQHDAEWFETPLNQRLHELNERKSVIVVQLQTDAHNRDKAMTKLAELNGAEATYDRWNRLNNYFGGTRFRTLVQSHILRPLLRNANLYLEQITDHYTLTCSDENEHLSILVLDRYNRNETRSATVLSGGERFMISLALSLALSAMSRPDMNVDILFIDEGFGTLDARCLEQVMSTLRRLPQIAGQTGRRVGVISHREELAEQIDAKILLRRCGEGRSRVEIE